MRVVGLFRVSTEKQADQGASLDAQERRFHELAAQHKWTVVATFKGAESATQASSDRRVLQQVLACIRDEKVDAISVFEQSRLTRADELEVALLMRELRERNTKIIVGGVIRDLGSIDERFMVGIQSLVDRAESERIKERLGRGKKEKARQGKRTAGAAPFGYSNPPPGDPRRGKLQVVPEEAAVVRRIFEMRAAGANLPAIAAELVRLGVAPPRAGRWGKTTLLRIFQNPTYIGTAISNGWVEAKKRSFVWKPSNPDAIIVENAHEPIVDREIWDAVQARPKAATAKVPRMLSGLLYVNGTKFGGDSNKRMGFYRGPRGMNGLAWLDTDPTDDAVWSAFTSMARGEDFVRQLMESASLGRNDALAHQEIEFLEERLAKASRRLDRLVEMRSGDEIDKATFVTKSAAERAAIETMTAELAEQRSKLLSGDASHAVRLARAVQLVLGNHRKLTCQQKRQILRSLVRRVDIAAEYVAASIKRDASGRVLPGRTQRWQIRQVGLQFVLPRESDPAARTRRGPTSGVTAGSGAEVAERDPAEFRRGQSDTNFLSCGQVAGTGDDSDGLRHGQSGTIL